MSEKSCIVGNYKICSDILSVTFRTCLGAVTHVHHCSEHTGIIASTCFGDTFHEGVAH